MITYTYELHTAAGEYQMKSTRDPSGLELTIRQAEWIRVTRKGASLRLRASAVLAYEVIRREDDKAIV